MVPLNLIIAKSVLCLWRRAERRAKPLLTKPGHSTMKSKIVRQTLKRSVKKLEQLKKACCTVSKKGYANFV
jgi:hypothetical protein